MKIYRRLVVLLFVIVAAAFAYYQVRYVRTQDKVAPEISMDSDTIQVSVEATNEDLMQGMSATDNRDGDVSDSLMVESKTKFFAPGKFEVTYDAFDAAGNVSKASRTVEYTDYTSPVLHLVEPLRLENGDYQHDIQALFTAEDVIDGDISGKIKYALGEDFNSYVSGTYVLAVQVSNSFGDTVKEELEMTVLDTDEYDKPFPCFDEYLLTTKEGEEIDPLEHLIGVQVRSAQYEFDDPYVTQYEPEQVMLSDGEVDWNTPGVYKLTYSYHSRVSAASVDEDDLTGATTVLDEETGIEMVDMVQGSVDVFVVVQE